MHKSEHEFTRVGIVGKNDIKVKCKMDFVLVKMLKYVMEVKSMRGVLY